MGKTRVLIADDHTVFRRGLLDILSEQQTIEVIGEASDGNEAFEKAKTLKPDVVLMDLWMPNCDGVEATRRLKAEMPEVNVLVITVSDKDADLFNAIKAGARGYLLKDEEPEQIIQAIQYVALRGVIVSPTMAGKLLNEFDSRPSEVSSVDHASLSPREQEVLRLVARGSSNKAIAATLVISENTVKTHLSRILEKLHLMNRVQAVAYAVRTGLVPDNK